MGVLRKEWLCVTTWEIRVLLCCFIHNGGVKGFVEFSFARVQRRRLTLSGKPDGRSNKVVGDILTSGVRDFLTNSEGQNCFCNINFTPITKLKENCDFSKP